MGFADGDGEDFDGTFTREPHSFGVKCGLRIFARMIKTFHQPHQRTP
jgi:hypothetical protein